VSGKTLKSEDTGRDESSLTSLARAKSDPEKKKTKIQEKTRAHSSILQSMMEKSKEESRSSPSKVDLFASLIADDDEKPKSGTKAKGGQKRKRDVASPARSKSALSGKEKKHSRLVQLSMDLGQSSLGPKECPRCGMVGTCMRSR
jgi:hypothetical protein